MCRANPAVILALFGLALGCAPPPPDDAPADAGAAAPDAGTGLELVCPEGFGDCDGEAANGCEAALDTADRCGACDLACPSADHAEAACASGACTLVCEQGFGDCDGDPANGCEAALDAPTSCGACGNTCQSFDHAEGACLDPTTGACGVSCEAGWGNCDGNPGNGCETELDSAAHCGACGASCEAHETAAARCADPQSGRCEATCQPGLADCDGEAANGCETDLDLPEHCGACGAACPDAPFASGTCTDWSTGACGLECDPGRVDLDGDPANGCEVQARETACDDGLDDDADGATDCADADCDTDPVCHIVPEPEHCGDGVDNDRDGAVDCADVDCTPETICGVWCLDGDLGSALGRDLATGSTAGAGDDTGPRCTLYPGEDVAFTWTAPATGRYRFDTLGSGGDTTLHVREAQCDGTPIGCNDDAEGGSHAVLLLDLAAHETVVVTVDTLRTPASYLLSIEASEEGLCADGADNDGDGAGDCADTDCATDAACAPCPGSDLGSALGANVAVGSTYGGHDLLVPGCATSTAPDAAFTWTAPAAGTYTFDTLGSVFDTVVFILDATCGGAELACNDDDPLGQGSLSTVSVSLATGQTVVVVVTGFAQSAGGYQLNIRQ